MLTNWAEQNRQCLRITEEPDASLCLFSLDLVTVLTWIQLMRLAPLLVAIIITIRDLLTERSGLPDINALPNYDEILQRHQTPSSLIAEIKGRPLLFEPGSNFLHEEHSAYNLLALIVEKKTGLPFAAAVRRLVVPLPSWQEAAVVCTQKE
jgi:Beta-lactamase